MKLIEFLKNKLGRKNDVKSSNIISLNDLLQRRLPKKEDLTEEDKELLEEYKKAYKQELKENKVLTFNSDSQEKVALNTNIILNNYLEELNDLSMNTVVDDMSKEEEMKVDQTIKILKWDLYLNEIEKTKKEVTLKLMALLEISKERKFYILRKLKEIKEQIESITTSLVIIEGQSRSIINETNAFKSELEMIESSLTVDEEEKILERKYNELLNLVKIISPEITKKLESMDIDRRNKVAYLEMYLEKYAFLNKDELYKLHDQVNNLDRVSNKNDIANLESRYKIFVNYARFHDLKDMIKEDLNVLYEMKFYHILEYSTNEIINNLNYMEASCYENIIMKKMEKIFKDEEGFLKDKFKGKIGKAVNLIKEIFKDDETKEFYYWNILNNRLLLRFLLNLDSRKNLLRFFHDCDLAIGEEKYVANPALTWQKDISLEALVWIKKSYDNPESEIKNNNLITEFGALYDLLMECMDDTDVYNLPEGLVSINIKKYGNTSFLNNIKEAAEGKRVSFPSTIKDLDNVIYATVDITQTALKIKHVCEIGDPKKGICFRYHMFPPTREIADKLKNFDGDIFIDEGEHPDRQHISAMFLLKEYEHGEKPNVYKLTRKW